MNEVLLKFTNFIKGGFWDWQFFFFVFAGSLVLCLRVLDRERKFSQNRLFLWVLAKTGESDQRNALIVLGFNLLAVGALVAIVGIPVPQTHDEFGYLLAADTFRHGRIVNPTPFSPAHFEYFHILVEPFYTAKYPPLQGIFLALGKLSTGLPIAGVWLSGLLSSLALYWLLRAFFPRSWALFGTILWIFAPLNLVWLDSYWGAHLAAAGGALSAGAFFRILTTGDGKNLYLWGVGIFLLLNSRLYEGTVLTAVLVFLWLIEIVRNGKTGNRNFRNLTVFGAVVVVNLAVIGVYNYAVTRDAFVLPYALHHARYHRVPLFVFQNPGAPQPDVPPIVKKLDDKWLAEFESDYESPLSAGAATAERVPIYLVWLTRSPFLLLLFGLGLFCLAKNPVVDASRQIPLILALFLIALFLPAFKGDRFIAPVVGLAFLAITFVAKMLYREKGSLRYLVPLLPLIVGGGYLAGLLWLETKKAPLPVVEDNFLSRGQIVDFLEAQHGKHLIFIETEKANPADARFYVYNEAVISAAKIIWAHDLREEKNRTLREQYPDRKFWSLKYLDNRAVLTAYDGAK